MTLMAYSLWRVRYGPCARKSRVIAHTRVHTVIASVLPCGTKVNDIMFSFSRTCSICADHMQEKPDTDLQLAQLMMCSGVGQQRIREDRNAFFQRFPQLRGTLSLIGQNKRPISLSLHNSITGSAQIKLAPYQHICTPSAGYRFLDH